MNVGPSRAARRTAATVVAVLAVLLLGAGPVWSHSELARSDPPNGGMVPVGRSFLTFWFGEPVDLAASTFDLSTLDGKQVEVTVSAGETGDVLRVDTAPLEQGSYELTWRVLSLEDAHPSSGDLVFGAGTRPDGVPVAGTDSPELPVLVVRWLDLSAVILAVGALAVSGRVLGSLGVAGRRQRARARSIAAVSMGAAVGTGMLTPFVRTLVPGGSFEGRLAQSWSTLGSTPWGHTWMVREVVVVLAAGVAWTWARRGEEREGSARGVALGLLVVVAVLQGWAGHASTLPRESSPAALASAAHLLAAGVWAGGLVVLAVCVLPVMRREPDRRGPILASVWRAYSPVAAAASVVLVATGVYAAGRHIPSLDTVTSVAYSEGVAAKLLLAALALAVAGVNTVLVNPSVAARAGRLLGRPAGWSPVSLSRFPRTVTAELLVLLAAVGAAAFVTSVPTTRETQAAVRASAPRSDNVDGLFLTFEAVPVADRTRLVVRERSTVRPEHAPVTGVEVVVEAPGAISTVVPLTLLEPGHYEGEMGSPEPGPRVASVVVHRGGLPDTVMEATWRVVAPSGVQVGPVELTTTTLAVLILVGAVGVARRQGRRRSGADMTARVAAGHEELSST